MSGQTGPDQHQTRHQRRVRQREVDCELPTIRAPHHCARPSVERLVADRPQLLDSVDRAGCGGRPAAARTVVAKNRCDLLQLRHVVLEHTAVEAAGMQQDDRAPFAPQRPMERHDRSLATAQLPAMRVNVALVVGCEFRFAQIDRAPIQERRGALALAARRGNARLVEIRDRSPYSSSGDGSAALSRK